MSILRFYNTTKGRKLINLSFISTFETEKNKLIMYKTFEREDIFGTFLLFSGGKTTVEEVECKDKEEANKELESIKNSLDEYYKKK